jgi:ferredoxin
MLATPPDPADAPELPPASARLLGAARATEAQALRQRLWRAGLRWPAWIDARPGRLAAIVGACSDPLLGLHRAALIAQHGPLLREGLGAFGLALAAPRLALVSDDKRLASALRQLAAGTPIEAVQSSASFPAQPERALDDLAGAPWVVPAEQLVAAGALLRGLPAPQLCSLVGAVAKPQALDLARLPATATPRQLVSLCGGARVADWVALGGEPLRGQLLATDQPLAAGTTLVYILPTDHPLFARHRLTMGQRIATTCLSCQLCTEICPQAASGTAPHRLLRALASKNLRPADVRATQGCTSCDACSAICPAELLPGQLVSDLAAAAADQAVAAEPPALASASRLPQKLVLQRLDLSRYDG